MKNAHEGKENSESRLRRLLRMGAGGGRGLSALIAHSAVELPEGDFINPTTLSKGNQPQDPQRPFHVLHDKQPISGPEIEFCRKEPQSEASRKLKFKRDFSSRHHWTWCGERLQIFVLFPFSNVAFCRLGCY